MELSWRSCLRVGATAVAVYLVCAGREGLLAAVSSAAGALSPLLIGGGVACVAEIPVLALERRLFPRGGVAGRAVCLTLALGGMAAAALWLAGVILPELLRCATLMAGGLPQALESLQEWLSERGAAQVLTALPDAQELTALALERAGGMLKTAVDALSAVTAGAANAALSLVFAAYLLAGRERIGAQVTGLIRRLPGEGTAAWVLSAMRALRTALRVYIAGQCMEALLLGCLCLLGMMVLRLPQALTVSALAGASALIPLMGTPIAAAAGAVLLLPESPAQALTFAVFFLILQQVESNLIYPRLVGATLGLHPVWMLTAMLVGGGLCGLAGAMLAVPVAAAIRTLMGDQGQ